MNSKIIRIIALFLVVCSCISITACSPKPGDGNETTVSEVTTDNAADDTTASVIENKEVCLVRGSEPQFNYLRADKPGEEEQKIATSVYEALCAKTNVNFEYNTDWVKKQSEINDETPEILFGFTNRPQTQEACELAGYTGWTVKSVGQKILICAYTLEGLRKAADYFVKTTLEALSVKTENGEEVIYADKFYTEVGSNYNKQLEIKTDPFANVPKEPATASRKEFSEILTTYNDAAGRLMSISHRGDWRTYPENSLAGIKSCIYGGIDIVEIDVRKTKDGVWVLCHDDSINRTTNGKGKIADLTYAQIQQYFLKSGKGGDSASVTEHKMPTFIEVLQLCLKEGKIILNLDKCWGSRDEIYRIAEEYGCLDICMFKGGEMSSWISSLKAAGKTLPLACGSYWTDNYVGFSTYIVSGTGLLSSIESGFGSFEAATASKVLLGIAKQNKIRGVALTLSASYSAGLTDDQCGWTGLTDIGYSIVMTEFPKNLAAYIENISSVRDATVPLRAENFNSHIGAELTTKSGARENKTLTGLNCGDGVVYKNLDFGDGLDKIIIKAMGTATVGATVAVRFDRADGEPVTVIKVDKTTDFELFGAEFAQVSGKHDVYLTFDSGSGDLLDLELLVFSK